ncbi:putative tRNA (uracil(54)-C(5))-methyltransferase [Clavispora lusitaniae]|uniref:TRAM domain-containing protein n=3 Tax=Clavispora lusitaniae TaxID=36911 RepID=C4Y3W6_CLAL4|nr:uncharacterized protein CLUG_02338 [Clavispora lusitaniae ATCC 42720]KAF7580383.1 tRNA (Uracil-5-)-methyltransferase family protein [Clavispora lusitaniae]EEQ38212.1 hypothetical protein CLUG_02338 [Clavispora lusitaniae ATCC 42720]OVF05514.1 putative tRNA (uracil(54)-C(5))-methyltransferase [Clavispora lusitaniae]QFZ27950.1 putative tRNA (uracil(54)-C(5))-methyltransferase [Clavispora lusitaniae]QFZ32743.1 putative tRNA (uracil(54)-C(5))-methyltransferase [Clavispora lusitaniae]
MTLFSILPKQLSNRCLQIRAASSYASLLKKKTKRGTTDKTSRDQILHLDITNFLREQTKTLDHVKIPEDLIFKFLFAKKSEQVDVQEVHILALTSEGEGLALIPRSSYYGESTSALYTVVKVPKTTVGDVVTIRLRRHHEFYAEADLTNVTGKRGKNAKRNDRLVVCQHFNECNGCQIQMISYEDQLKFKADVIQRAYRYFHPELKLEELHDFGFVVPSPLQYSYRTKLTPHAKVPRSLAKTDLPLAVGFDSIRKISPLVDIQNCPIAAPSINKTIPYLKERFQKTLEECLETGSKKKIDSNFLLRDSMQIDGETGSHEYVCLTRRNNVITEKIGEFLFQFEANEFFQNNRSILPTFLEFIKFHLSQIPGGYTHLIDAYCGSGFLGISLSDTLPQDGKVFGIEISKKSIAYAKHNAGINGLDRINKVQFVHGNSDSMFTDEQFLRSGVNSKDCVLLMNPSRKGSTEEFMAQLLEFKPKAIIYISCNVFSQARDLATFERLQRRSSVKYKVKTITGFDFYPQTKHVETVAILELEN